MIRISSLNLLFLILWSAVQGSFELSCRRYSVPSRRIVGGALTVESSADIHGRVGGCWSCPQKVVRTYMGRWSSGQNADMHGYVVENTRK
jgi:hypothetical protein